MTDNNEKEPGLKITNLGKLILILMGVAILMPFVGVALAVVMVLVIAALVLGLGLVAALIAVLVAIVVAILHAMGVALPWPLSPWI